MIGVFVSDVKGASKRVSLSMLAIGFFSGCSTSVPKIEEVSTKTSTPTSAVSAISTSTSTIITEKDIETTAAVINASKVAVKQPAAANTNTRNNIRNNVANTKPAQRVVQTRKTNTAQANNAKYVAEYEKKKLFYQQKWEQEQNRRIAAQRTEQSRRTVAAAAVPRQGQRVAQGQVLPRARAQNVNWRPQPRQSNVYNEAFAERLSQAALRRTKAQVTYDGRYIPIAYPNGDVPPNIGVCSDVIVRSYRQLGIDLQRLVHEDMTRAFAAYPNPPEWGLSAPDPNIDHRRVFNLKVFFSRYGQRLPISNDPRQYKPGDMVTWDLRNGGQQHLGIVVNRRSPSDPNRLMIVHNIGSGVKLEDILFTMPITGHYRYQPNLAGTYLARN